ncbi:MAG: protoporphyrinogen oxidase HemJ [Pseudomonadota bacterium]
MTDVWLWSKAIHFMAFAAWMAGLWYLPRLYIYHSGVAAGSEASERFKVMERRLLKAITTPAMVVTFVAGVVLIQTGVGWNPGGWLHAKLTLLLLMGAFHGVLAADLKKFARDERPRSAVTYRVLNEVPTVLFILIVLLAVFRPF